MAFPLRPTCIHCTTKNLFIRAARPNWKQGLGGEGGIFEGARRTCMIFHNVKDDINKLECAYRYYIINNGIQYII